MNSLSLKSRLASLLAASLLVLGSGVVSADERPNERIDSRVDAPADGTVEIENMAGSITVTGWDREEVHVEGRVDPAADDFDFRNEGEFTVIKVKYPSRRGGFWNDDVDISGSELRISVPKGSRLIISSISADVDVSDSTGDVEVETISGSMDIETLGEDIQLESISGSVRLSDTREGARVDVETVSGSSRLTGIRGELDVSSVSGSMRVSRSVLSRGEFENTSGDIEVEAEFSADGDFRFEAISGDVDLRFMGTPNGNFDVTTFSGDIDNSFGPEPKKISRYTPNLELKFSTGEGDADFRINTMSGDIEIRN
ncbi:MAG: DUF4097 family beta strand repeat-containing protein [Gammaproteobacteria bacterium]|nr:DUF4097 family beta strand repeat-containing protein [Gammaproteobacteria bacterium]